MISAILEEKKIAIRWPRQIRLLLVVNTIVRTVQIVNQNVCPFYMSRTTLPRVSMLPSNVKSPFYKLLKLFCLSLKLVLELPFFFFFHLHPLVIEFTKL